MDIKVLSRKDFEELLLINNIDDQNVESHQEAIFISILNTLSVPGLNHHKPVFKNPHYNVITLTFDDTMEETFQSVYLTGDINNPTKIITGVPMSEKQAEELVQFLSKHLAKNLAIVHCSAGISRSGAIGLFLSDITRSGYEKFKRENPMVIPNGYVYRLLKKKYEQFNK